MAEKLAGVVRAVDSARAIGRAYLAAWYAKPSCSELAQGLWPSEIYRQQAAQTEVLRSAVLERSRADFAAGRIVSVDGWVLSETEARLCALITQLPGLD